MKQRNKFFYKALFPILFLLVGCSQSNAISLDNPGARAAEDMSPPEIFVVKIPTITPTAIDIDVPMIAKTEAPLPSSTPLTTEVVEILATPSLVSLACTNVVEFEKNLTISEGSLLKENNLYAKVWRVKNVGTCIWTTGYKLVFIEGDPSLNISGIPLPLEVHPGETVDLKVDFPTMDVSNTYTGKWVLESDTGTRFGVGTNADQPLILSFIVKAKSKLPGIC